MAHDVFISYSSIDKDAASDVCTTLEKNEITCWIAPRDITPGKAFSEAIIDGIQSSKVFVIVYSSNTNNSNQVIREVDRAVHNGLSIINFRLENVPLSKQLEYYLSSVHWLDAMTPPLEQHINQLCNVIQMFLKPEEVKDAEIAEALRKGIIKQKEQAEIGKGSNKAKNQQDDTAIEKSIAVLPFRNDSPDEENTYFINGIMEEILNNLQKINDLRVISRTSVEQYRNQNKPITKIAEELGVNYIVEGSGQKYGNTFRLRAQLIMAVMENHLWGESFQQEMTDAKDIFRIQSQIAETIASELGVAITSNEKRLIEKPPTIKLDAYDAYLKGQFYWRKLTKEDLENAMKYFELAKEKDPDYALAYAGISKVWSGLQQMGFVPPSEAGPKAMGALMKALELDNSCAEVHSTLAAVKTWGMWDWEGGESSFKSAISLNPNYAEAHAYYSHFLNMVGRPEEAMEHIELALLLDPYNPLLISLYSIDLVFVRRYEDAITAARKALKTDPASKVALIALEHSLYHTGRYEEALDPWKSLYYNTSKEVEQAFDQGYAKSGYEGALNQAADALVLQTNTSYINPFWIAQSYLMAGNKEKALKCLDMAFEVRDSNLPYLLLPICDSLRNEPRFQEIARKMKLPYKLGL